MAIEAGASALTAEHCWLVACVRHGGRVPRPGSWSTVVALAETEGLDGALACAVRGTPAEAVPPDIRVRLARRLAEATGRHVLMTAELARVLGAFGAAELPAIVLKGAVLAETLYPHPAARPYNDLDLLVRPDDRLRADACLQALGYTRFDDEHSWSFDVEHDGAAAYDGPSGVRVDLHWRLLTEPRYVWNAAAADVWARARTVAVDGVSALALEPVDLLLYLAAHFGAHHGLAGLLWSRDIALLLERAGEALDWAVVVERAAQWRVRRAVFFALVEVERAWGIAPPPAVFTRLAPAGLRAMVLRALLRRATDAQRRRLDRPIALLLVDRAGDAARALGRVVCPSPAWVAARYSAASRCRGYVAHYRRALRVAVSTARALARVAVR